MTPAAALERLYASESADAEWFAPSFLVAVPLSKVKQIGARVRARGGAFREVRELGGERFEIVFEKATFDAKIRLDDAGQITGVRVSAANEDRWPDLATDCVRAWWKHLAVSIAIIGAALAWFVWRHASKVSFVVVAGIGVFLVGYNLARIRLARRALRDPSLLRAFEDGQRRSHRVRGRIFLFAAPILTAVTWMGFVSEPHAPLDAWLLMITTTLFLGWGWVMWWRTLRRLAA